MRRKSFIIISLLAILVAWPLLAQAEPVGKFTSVEGNVDVTAPGMKAVKANLGDPLNVGDIIRTKSKSRCEVAFIDGSILRLAENSRLRVTEFVRDKETRTATLSLFRGKIQNIVKRILGAAGAKSKYEVRMPTAVAGVRGTNFFTFFQRGVSGAIFKEGKGYGYSLNRPGEVKTIEPGKAMIVTSPDLPPMIKPATDLEIQQHEKDTAPSEKPKGEGEKGEETKTGETPGFIESASTETPMSEETSGVVQPVAQEEVVQEVPPPPTTPLVLPTELGSVTEFSGTLNFYDVSVGSLSGSVGTETNTGEFSVEGTAGGTSSASGVDGTMSDGSSFAGYVMGVSGSWRGLMSSLYVTGSGAGYLYGSLSGAFDAGTGAYSGSGTATRTGILAGTTIVPDLLLDSLELLGRVEDSYEEGYPLPVLGSIDAGGAISPYANSVLGEMAGITTTGGAKLGVWGVTTDGGSYSNSYGTTWYGLYGQIVDGYLLGAVSATDDMAGHVTITGDINYMDAEYLGSIGLNYYGTYSGSTYNSAGAGTYTLEPLAWSGCWGGDLYYNDLGSTAPAGYESGYIGGLAAPWSAPSVFTAMGEYSYTAGGYAHYLWNSYVDGGTAFAGGDGYMYGNTAGIWKAPEGIANYGVMMNGGALYALYYNAGTVGVISSNDVGGYFYPGLGMWIAQGTLTPTQMTSGLGSVPYEGSGSLYARVAGGFTLAPESVISNEFGGDIQYFTVDGENLPWGVYNLSSGDYGTYLYKPSGNAVWSAKVGGSIYVSPDYGYWFAGAGGYWNDAGEITGSITGRYLSPFETGTIGGPFYGINTDDTWIGQSVGMYQKTAELQFVNDFYSKIFQSGGPPDVSTGSLSGLMGGTMTLWSDDVVPLTLLGNYSTSPSYVRTGVWFSDRIYSHNYGTHSDTTYDGGAYVGFTGGIVQEGDSNDTLGGRIVALYIDPDGNAGYLRGGLGGYGYPDIEMFEMDGSLGRTQVKASGDVGISAGDLYSSIIDGYGYGGLSGIIGSNGSITGPDGLALCTLAIGNQRWGIYELQDYGAFTGTGSGNWSAQAGGHGEFGGDSAGVIDSGYWLADINGTYSEGRLAGTLSGRFITETKLGMLAGDWLGTYNDAGGTWEAASLGTWEGTPLAWSGCWGGDLSYNDLGSTTYAGSESGYIGGLTAPWSAPSVFTAMGLYSYTADGYAHYLWNSYVDGGTAFAGGDGYIYGNTAGIWKAPEGGASYGVMMDGGALYALYYNAGTAGVISSNDVGGYFYPGLDMWIAQGTLTPTPVTFGLGAVPEEGSGSLYASFAGGFTGAPGSVILNEFDGYTNCFTVDGENLPWGIYKLSFGYFGEYSGKPSGNAAWSAKVGGSVYVSPDYGYWFAGAGGYWNDAGEITGSISGKYLTPFETGTIGGPFYGINNGYTWIGQSVGMYQQTAPLQFASDFSPSIYQFGGDPGYSTGDLCGLMGGTMSLWSGSDIPLTFLGEYSTNLSFVRTGVWSSDHIYSHNYDTGSDTTYDGGAYVGFAGGSLQENSGGDLFDGRIIAICIDPYGNAGLLRGSVAGYGYPDIGMFDMAGSINRYQLKTSSEVGITPADLSDSLKEGNLYFLGHDGELFGAGMTFLGDLYGREDQVSTAKLLYNSSYQARDHFGIWSMDSVGTFAGDPGGSGTWVISAWKGGSDQDLFCEYDAIGSFNNGKLSGNALGYLANLKRGGTVLMAGETLGTSHYDSGDWYFQAITTGAFVSTPLFLSMVDDVTGAGKEALAALGFATTEVTSSGTPFGLSGTQPSLPYTGVTINPIRIFSRPSLPYWYQLVAPSISGSYEHASGPTGVGAMLVTNSATPTFYGRFYIGDTASSLETETGQQTWIGEFDGLGAIYTGSTWLMGEIDGAASGTYTGTISGNFGGGAAGMFYPASFLSPIDENSVSGSGYLHTFQGEYLDSDGYFNGMMGSSHPFLWQATPVNPVDVEMIGAYDGSHTYPRHVFFAYVSPYNYATATSTTVDGGSFYGSLMGIHWDSGETYPVAPSNPVLGYMGGLYRDPSGNAGILLGKFGWNAVDDQWGEFDVNNANFSADGTIYPVQLGSTTVGAAAFTGSIHQTDFTYTRDVTYTGHGEFFDASGNPVSVYVLSMPSELEITSRCIDDLDAGGFGTWGTMFYGAYGDDGLPGHSSWGFEMTGNNAGRQMGWQMHGDQPWATYSPPYQNMFEGNVEGYWSDVSTAPATGIITGKVLGTFDPDYVTYQAVSGGVWMETGKFLGLQGGAVTTETANAALKALNIPAVQVGTATLIQSGSEPVNGLVGVTMENVGFFATSTGQAPKIWATGSVGGGYTSAPLPTTEGGGGVLLSGSGLNAVFGITNWNTTNNLWTAKVIGGGTLSGGSYTGDINFRGAAAGAINSVPATSPGAFSGTAAGVAKQAPAP